jgi:hypothetical protein
MTIPPDYRALCAELFDELQSLRRAIADEMGCASPEPDLVTRARTLLAAPEAVGVADEADVDDILRLAAIIRRVDGNHDKGAAALAEAILSHPEWRMVAAHPAPVPVGVRPWERDGWLDPEYGWCWFCSPKGSWSLAIPPSNYGDPICHFPYTFALPHWALPLPGAQ